MNLTKLEISGFKSFRDKVVLDFATGVTAVVGPNGCGKSNVLDAIRWVMGEQRVKALRGKKMDDVVFNGSQESAPVSLAEVTMTVSANGQSFTGAYAELSEISITRRVVREGESEYYINRAPCRLLDVKEFFMGAGVGTRTYSLVEQGSVANMVEAKPEDRRLFIEDAAGVSKYKSRKESAVRKIEATKQNMQRLNDILKEVKSQLNTISRQAKRAEQYKELKHRLRETEITLALQNYTEILERKTAMQALRNERQDEEKSIRAALEARESELTELKTRLLENDDLINKRQEELYEFKNSINIKEKNIEFYRRQITNLSERKQKDAADIDLLQAREANLLNEMATFRKNAEDAAGQLAALLSEHEEGRRQIQELSTADKEINDQLEEKKIFYIDIVTEKARLRNMISSLTKNIDDLRKRGERENREIEEDKKRLAEIAARLISAEEALAADEEEFHLRLETKESAAGELEKAKNDLIFVEERIVEIKELSGGKMSRLQSLKEFQETYKWSNEGVREIIKKQENSGRFYGVVADHINVPREYEISVEAVLGDKLQYVVVKSQEDGVEAIKYLKSSRKGRGSFVPVETGKSCLSGFAAEHLSEAESLLSKVTCDENFRHIAECFLGDVFIASTVESGIDLWKKNGFRGTFVTPEGDIISSHGALTGGRGSAGEKSLLAAKREIAELEKEIATLADEFALKAEKKKKLVLLITQWEEELSTIKNRIHKLEIEINSRRKDAERFGDETGRLKQRIAVLEFNRQNIKSEETEAEEKLRSISADIVRVEEEEKSVNEVISFLNVRREQSRQKIDEQEKLLTGKRILLAALEEKKVAETRTIARLESDVSSTKAEVRLKQEEIISGEKQIAELMAAIEAEHTAVGDFYLHLAAGETLLTDLQAEKNREDERLKVRENEIREIKKKLDDLRGQINEIELSCREAALREENLKSAVIEKHNVSLERQLPEFAPPDEQKMADLTSLLETDRMALDNFGEVNLLALNEFEELDKRYSFLSSQYADLNASLAALQRTITRINKISRSRFAETFAAVNNCFKEVFAYLFPGGQGELRLTDENDLLETGVDIDIQIPGKRTQNVSLLSGGEKSLVAIALIFAILMYRPTSFLVLDEVDAALDDANINLFNRLIRDIAGRTQVVMITHNKSTMEVADSLFGVTMQKQGISSIVSVNLH